jgi:thiaminase
MTLRWPAATKLSHTSPFIDQLEVTVAPLRQRTLESPFPLQLRDGTLRTAHYARLLVEIYHYVKHSTRLSAFAASRLEQTVIRDSAMATYAYYRRMLGDVWEDCEVRSAAVQR